MHRLGLGAIWLDFRGVGLEVPEETRKKPVEILEEAAYNQNPGVLKKESMAGSNRNRIAGTPIAALPAASPREVMDIRQAADYLGISADSLYKYASEGFIPAFKLGNRWRFKRSLLERWIELQSSQSMAPVRPKQKKPVARAR
jgi:excisionase family DNA binding protein